MSDIFRVAFLKLLKCLNANAVSKIKKKIKQILIFHNFHVLKQIKFEYNVLYIGLIDVNYIEV